MISEGNGFIVLILHNPSETHKTYFSDMCAHTFMTNNSTFYTNLKYKRTFQKQNVIKGNEYCRQYEYLKFYDRFMISVTFLFVKCAVFKREEARQIRSVLDKENTVNNKKTHTPCFSTLRFPRISPEPLELQKILFTSFYINF